MNNSVLISLELYVRTFSNISGIVLNLETAENGAEFPKMYGNRDGNTYGSVG